MLRSHPFPVDKCPKGFPTKLYERFSAFFDSLTGNIPDADFSGILAFLTSERNTEDILLRAIPSDILSREQRLELEAIKVEYLEIGNTQVTHAIQRRIAEILRKSSREWRGGRLGPSSSQA